MDYQEIAKKGSFYTNFRYLVWHLKFAEISKKCNSDNCVGCNYVSGIKLIGGHYDHVRTIEPEVFTHGSHKVGRRKLGGF